MVNLMLYVSWLLHRTAIPLSLKFSGLWIPQDMTVLIRPVSKLQQPLSVQVKGVVMSLALNHKLQIMKLSEERMLKAKASQQLGLLCPTAKLWM